MRTRKHPIYYSILGLVAGITIAHNKLKVIATIVTLFHLIILTSFSIYKNRPTLGRFHYWLPTTQVTTYR